VRIIFSRKGFDSAAGGERFSMRFASSGFPGASL